MSIEIKWPRGTYPNTKFNFPYEYVEYDGMMQFLANGLLDDSLIHWCEMCLYDYKSLEEPTHMAYFNAQYITGKECEQNLASVKTVSRSLQSSQTQTIFFLLHSFYSGHWVLFVISPSQRKGWIFDPSFIRGKKDKNHYTLTKVIELLLEVHLHGGWFFVSNKKYLRSVDIW